MRTKEGEEKKQTTYFFLDEKVWGKNLKHILYIYLNMQDLKKQRKYGEKSEKGPKPFNKFLQIEGGKKSCLEQKNAGAVAGGTVLTANVKGRENLGEIIEKHN